MRDARGRWVKGTTGNPGGQKKGNKSARYWAITQNTCTLKDWRAIITKAIEQAKGGDKHARAWLADRLIGSVTAKLKTTIDVGETLNEDLERALDRILGPDASDGAAPGTD